MNPKVLLLASALTLIGTANNVQAKSINCQSLAFRENKGQIMDQYGQERKDIDFQLTGKPMNLYIGSGQLHYQWNRNTADELTTSYRMDVQLLGVNPKAKAVVSDPTDGRKLYSGTNSPAYAYRRITYKNVYPHIDWTLYIQGDKVEYDFIVHPGGRVSDIQLQYDGADQLSLDNNMLSAGNTVGAVTEQGLYAYTKADRKQVRASFVLDGNIVRFKTTAYKGTLVIDPTLDWATYYGGNKDEIVNATVTDGAGNVYITGETKSAANIATTGSYQATYSSNYDAFIAKFNSSGNLIWATYYGGTGNDNGKGLAIDTAAHIYVAGTTTSATGIASSGSFHATYVSAGGGDGFLVKFDSSGNRLWGTYYGGSGADQAYAVICDKAGNAYVTGYASSDTGIATSGSYLDHDPTTGSNKHAFLAKFSPSGSRIWATYYGGNGADYGTSLAKDSSDNIYLGGYTSSSYNSNDTGVATAGAFQATYSGGSYDAFVAKFGSDGSLKWGTYYGGTGSDYGMGITCDAGMNVYLTGNTTSTDTIATSGSYQSTYGGSFADAFLVKFDSSGHRMWGTYYGGSGQDKGAGVSTNASGNIYISGTTSSTSAIATTGAFKDTLDGFSDAFLAKFSSSGTLDYATYYGGEDEDDGYAISCDGSGNVYIAGSTYSATHLATTGSYQATYGGGGFMDGFLVKFNDCGIPTAPAAITGDTLTCSGATYDYWVAPVSGAISYIWILPSGWTGSSTTDTIHVTVGNTSDTVKIIANFLCGSSDTTRLFIKVNPFPTLTPAGSFTICGNDSMTFTANTGSGLSYQWLINSQAISGATASHYTADSAGNYSVIVSTTYGCSDTTAYDTLLVNPVPVPVITTTGNVLSTGPFASYQWYHNGTAITGAVNQTYAMIIDSGDYTVTVTDGNGCSGTSAAYNPADAVANLVHAPAVHVYPIPASDYVRIDAQFEVYSSVYGMDGKAYLIHSGSKMLSIGYFPDGIYLIRMTDACGNLIGMTQIIKAAH